MFKMDLYSFKGHSVTKYAIEEATIDVVYLAVALIWRFGESRLYYQIKCTLFRL